MTQSEICNESSSSISLLCSSFKGVSTSPWQERIGYPSICDSLDINIRFWLQIKSKSHKHIWLETLYFTRGQKFLCITTVKIFHSLLSFVSTPWLSTMYHEILKPLPELAATWKLLCRIVLCTAFQLIPVSSLLSTSGNKFHASKSIRPSNTFDSVEKIRQSIKKTLLDQIDVSTTAPRMVTFYGN